MHWEDTPRLETHSPEGEPRFRVCILRVAEADSLPDTFAEFWRRVLAEGFEECVGPWEVLLIQMNLLGGGFTCAFTDSALERDASPVFKFSSARLEAECHALPERAPGGACRAASRQVIDRVAIEKAVRGLAPGYRAAFILHDVEGHDHEEVARLMGWKAGTSKSQLHKARAGLRGMLSARSHALQT